MNLLRRWGRFNVVGAMGMGVQLATLSLLHRWSGGHYLIATAAAVELTLLHNFAWHVRYTWCDRRDGSTRWMQLLRFQLSNGMVSMAGNLVLMRVLVPVAHLPVPAANAIAIGCCSLVNFWLGHCWAFTRRAKGRAETARTHGGISHMRSKLIALFALGLGVFSLLAGPMPAQAQDSPLPASSLPYAPSQMAAQARIPARDYPPDAQAYTGGVFCGSGASYSDAATKPTFGCGAGISFFPLPVFIEFGVMGPQANRSNVSGYMSLDGHIPLARTTTTYLPMAIVGYSRLFETGHALDYGISMAMPRWGPGRTNLDKSMRIELRDYWTFANPTQHNVMLRVGWTVLMPD